MVKRKIIPRQQVRRKVVYPIREKLSLQQQCLNMEAHCPMCETGNVGDLLADVMREQNISVRRKRK